MGLVLRMLFLSLSNSDVEFAKSEKLTWESYDNGKALPITSQIKLIGKKEFAKAALNQNSKIFVLYVTTLELSTTMLIHPLSPS